MILEGAFYSKYMLLPDYSGNMYAYDYSTCSQKRKWENSYNLAEDNSGNVYYMYVGKSPTGTYYDPKIRIFNGNSDSDEYGYGTAFSEDTNFSHTKLFDAYYDSTADIYWVAYAYWSNSAKKLYLCKKTDKYAEVTKTVGNFPFSSACIAT